MHVCNTPARDKNIYGVYFFSNILARKKLLQFQKLPRTRKKMKQFITFVEQNVSNRNVENSISRFQTNHSRSISRPNLLRTCFFATSYRFSSRNIKN